MTGCPACQIYADRLGWALVGACASVGIEHGKTTAEMAVEFLRGYHDRGHVELDRLPTYKGYAP